MKRTASAVLVVLAVFSLSSGQWLERRMAVGDTVGFRLDGGIVVNPVSGNVYIEGDPTRVFAPAGAAKVGTFNATGPLAFCPASGKAYIMDNPAVIIDAVADTAVGAVALPFHPAAIAYSVVSNRLYLESPNDNDPLFVFDPAGDSLVGTLAIGAPVTALLWDSTRDRLYVGTESDTGVLKVVDCAGDSLLGEVDLALSRVTLFSLSTISGKLYCAGYPDTTGGSAVVVVSTDSLVPVANVSGMRRPVHAAYSPVVNRVYFIDWGGDSLYAVDCSADTVRTRLAARLNSLAVSPLNGEVYAGKREVGPVLVLDTTDALSDSIPLPLVTNNNVGAVTFNPTRNEVYAALTDDFAFIANSSRSVTGMLDYIAYSPFQMVYNPSGSKLYLFCPSQNAVLVMDSTLETTARIYGGVTTSNAIAVLDSARNRICVADNQALRVLDCASDSMVSVLPLPGIDHPLPVLVPALGRLFIFNSYGVAGDVYRYDCASGNIQTVLHLTDAAPCAVFDPHSNLIYFTCEDAPALRVFDPATGSVVKEFEFGTGSERGRLVVNPDLGRLYYTDQNLGQIYTIDVDAESIIGHSYLGWNIDTLMLNPRFGKVYMGGRDRAAVVVFSCSRDTFADTVYADFQHAALMNERNDKLYLRYGAVVNCQYDYVMTRLDSINPRSMAWDEADNRVFVAALYRLYVYRDDPSAVEETRVRDIGPMLTVEGNPARDRLGLRLQVPPGETGRLSLYDAAGRLVHSLSVARTSAYEIDLRSVPSGIYFVGLKAGAGNAVEKVVVQR